MALYVIEKDNDLIVQGFVNAPDEYVCVLEDESIRYKKLKVVDRQETDAQGKPLVDSEGNPVMKKVAVVDEVKQAEYEAELKAKEDKEKADKLKKEKAKSDLLKAIDKGTATNEELLLMFKNLVEYLEL